MRVCPRRRLPYALSYGLTLNINSFRANVTVNIQPTPISLEQMKSCEFKKEDKAVSRATVQISDLSCRERWTLRENVNSGTVVIDVPRLSTVDLRQRSAAASGIGHRAQVMLPFTSLKAQPKWASQTKACGIWHMASIFNFTYLNTKNCPYFCIIHTLNSIEPRMYKTRTYTWHKTYIISETSFECRLVDQVIERENALVFCGYTKCY